MSETFFFVMVPVDGVSWRWPQDGPVKMSYRGQGNMALGWVKAETPEEAVSLFLEFSDNAPSELREEIQLRASGPAKVARMSDVVEVPL